MAVSVPLEFLDLRKNARECLRTHVREYKGLAYVDLRIWPAAEDGEYVPSFKGAMLKPGHTVGVTQSLLFASQVTDPAGVS